MIDEVIAFVNARLDERERLALNASNASSRDWSVSAEEPDRWAVIDDDHGTVATSEDGGIPEIVAQFIAVNDPTHELLDIAVKRRIIALYTHVQMSEPWGDNPSMPLGGDGPETYFDVVCLMAMIDTAHPDYKPEWNARFYGNSLSDL